MVQVRVNLTHDEGIAANAQVFIVGSHPSLGDWQDPVPMKRNDDKSLSVTIDFKGEENSDPGKIPEFEYKYTVEENGKMTWEAFSNRKSTGKSEINDTWNRLDGTMVAELDPYLEPFAQSLRARNDRFHKTKAMIDRDHGGLDQISRSYEKMGICKVEGGTTYREWAPSAKEMSLVGDFNNWDTSAHRMEKDEFGTFSIFIPDNEDGSAAVPHMSKVKCYLVTPSGEGVYRVPAWIRYALQEKDTTYTGVHWNPPSEEKHEWKHERLGWPSGVADIQSLKIYEAHVGMASNEPKVGTYKEFTNDVLPRIAALGYNAVQLMAIMEHVYYASFGYHVTNFFAVSSRCGTPEDLKALVDRAHELGLIVIMDMVHSHASKNVLDGINQFDGTDHHYFHEGARGNHDLWDSRLFNYSHPEVLRFLLANARWFVEEYKFDGYRFDGVTSMLYKHHGNGVGFTGNYAEYFGESSGVDEEAETYMQLVNELLHNIVQPPAMTIAEDVSGMPTLCRPVREGGLGFDFRLAMAIPDTWIKLLKEVPDEEWSMNMIVHTLTNRRMTESSIAYCESHDQALVGDKTIAFWLMDKEMYFNMSIMTPSNPVIERGIALHKLLRLLTCSLGGEGYLNFMGNEFGHPEWIDFPREGNGNSYQHCRRQWQLVDDPLLRYQHLSNFDRDMLHLENRYGWLQPQHHTAYITWIHEDQKVIVYEKANLVFVFNFHPTESFEGFRLGVSHAGTYNVALCSDAAEYGGHSRVDPSVPIFSQEVAWNEKPYSVQVYIPSRVAIVLSNQA